MSKKLILFTLVIFTLIVAGCSDTPDITGPGQDNQITLVQRPTFVDIRPSDQIFNSFKLPTAGYILDKKPPTPPPDTGSDPNPNPAHKYAYIVGISDYEGTANDLQFCDDDATEIRSYLMSQGFTVRMDLDRNATADAIAAGLDWLVASAVAGDEVAFFYSGHGTKVTGYGSSIISTDLYYLTHGYVMQKVNAVNTTKKLVAMDACVLGDFHTDTQTGTLMATASTSTNSYDAPTLNNGAWTYYFLEGAIDLSKIYGEDISSYAETKMRAWAKIYHLRVSPAHTDMYSGMMDI